MKRILCTVLALTLLALAAPACAKTEKAPEKLSFGVFGEVLIYRNLDRNGGEPGRAVLLLSEGAWDARMDAAARAMADMDATVVGIDTARLLAPLRAKADGCFYQAWEFEGLSKIVQKTLGYKGYHQPVLAGFGEGASVAYATFAQAPKEIFAGAITLGFSPRLGIQKPFCSVNGYGFDNATNPADGIDMRPVTKPFGQLVLLQGAQDKRFSVSAATRFASLIPGARVAALDGAAESMAEPKLWSQAFREAVLGIAARPMSYL